MARKERWEKLTFIKSFGVWSAFTCVPPIVLYVIVSWGSPKIQDLVPLLPLILIPVVGSVALFLVRNRLKSSQSGVWVGGLLGAVLPVAGALLWMQISPSFENAALIPSALLIAVPSAAGGGLAAWMYSRDREAVA